MNDAVSGAARRGSKDGQAEGTAAGGLARVYSAGKSVKRAYSHSNTRSDRYGLGYGPKRQERFRETQPSTARFYFVRRMYTFCDGWRASLMPFHDIIFHYIRYLSASGFRAEDFQRLRSAHSLART